MAMLGIDLGTTNSLIAYYADGKPTPIPNALGGLLTPSVVSFDTESGEIHIGEIARQRLVSHPEQTIGAFKRNMGTEKRYRLAGQDWSPEDLSALVLKSLKADAERHLGCKVEHAVISVPAYFNDTQRAATMTAARLAGMTVTRLINEPTAAAIVHGVSADNEKRFLVLDLGGGTFDVTLLEVFDGVLEVHASAGDNQLGGTDFDALLARHLAERAGLDRSHLNRLIPLAEKLRRELGERDTASIKAEIGGEQRTLSCDKETFESLVTPLLRRLGPPIAQALRDARIDPSQLDDVLFVGGATRMPVFRRFAAKLFRQFPNTTHDPDQVVVLGAAMQAGMAARDAALEDTILTDVMPFSLGTGVAIEGRSGQVFSPIIERNTTIPVSRVERFSAMRKGQRQVEFSIYQGESRNLNHNVKLGSMTVALPKNDEQMEIDLRFTYDNNGLLEVETTTVRDGESQRLVIQNNQQRMSDEAVEKSLKKLASIKIHPAEQQANKLVLARGERLYELSSGERRERISQLLAHFEAALDSQNPNTINQARDAVTLELDRLDEFDWS